MTMTVCILCGGPITQEERDTVHVMEQVAGFEMKRSEGGTNALRMRSRTGRAAHTQCVKRESRHVSARQETLL